MELPFVNWTVLTGLDCNLRCKYCYEKNKNGQVNPAPVFLLRTRPSGRGRRRGCHTLRRQ